MGQLVPSGRDAGAVQTPGHPSPGARPTVNAAASARTVRLGRNRYPLVLPTIRDPRLHLAAVIISIHVLGQTVLGFRVSVVQILVAILTCAVIEVTWTFISTRSLVWPASAMLTGSGVALIFRVLGTENGDYWSWHGWYLFAIVAGLSLLTKYVIKYRGSHVFNPSNVGLVAAFVVLGSTRVEPLDFWWAPLGVWMVAAYLIIVVGGVLITRRLHLLAMSVAFWISLAVGIGVVAASGHCMTARWAFAPVCGSQFLVGDRDVTGGLGLPVLHDHRPEDGAGRTGGPSRLRRVRRPGQHPADRTADDRVRRQGGLACWSRRHVRGPPAPRALLPCSRTRTRTDRVSSRRGSRRLERERRPSTRVHARRDRRGGGRLPGDRHRRGGDTVPRVAPGCPHRAGGVPSGNGQDRSVEASPCHRRRRRRGIEQRSDPAPSAKRSP